jgi:sulfate permease, SulP family
VVGDYARRLAAAQGRLYLSGLSPEVLQQLRVTGAVDLTPVRTFEATEVVGASTEAALREAEAWLVRHREA